ncbi:hypothetical protein A0H81_01945 [Grifola frondosa]|uniref:Uncharacterized protein n=1 Tax=Grifola frondosa TaxID=5627 RepID=A0A1C7MMU0_GRIFR|nr:hypothetical protein A0H81_01945 [Grifola frondosa]
MTSAGYYPPYSSRLPSYRFGHAERYHPYPRVSRPLDDRLMRTVDYRYVDEPTLEVPPSAARLRPVASCEEDPDGDVSTLALDGEPIAENAQAEDDLRAERRSKFARVFRVLLLLLQHKYLSLKVVRAPADDSEKHVLG